MKFKKIVATVLLLAMSCGLLCACADNEEKSSLAQFEMPEQLKTIKSCKAAENDSMELYWDLDTSSVQLRDKRTNETWSTIPYSFYQSGMSGSNYVLNGLRSSLYLTYVDAERNTEVKVVSYKDAVIAARKIENGLKLTYYFSNAEFSVPVNYVLNDDGMSVSVDVANITEGKNKILKVSVAPFFCSAENGRENYLFVPSGSGALMYADDDQRSSRSYSEPVYGIDITDSPVYQNTKQESVRMPVFGAKNGNNGMLAIITSGAEMATIDATAGDSQYGYSAAYATFTIRGSATSYISNSTNGSNKLVQYSADVVNVDPCVRYILLQPENADYNGMANTYRDYLKIEEGMKEGVATPDLILNILGGAVVNRVMAGIPYSEIATATTFEQAQEILRDIVGKTDATMAVNLKGFGSTGLDVGELGGGFEADGAFGGEKDLRTLTQWCAENGADSFFDYELVFYTDSGNGFSVRNSAVKANMIRAKYYLYDIVTHEQTGDAYYLANRYELVSNASKIAKYGKKLTTTGIGMSTLSSTAWSDYRSRYYSTKNYMAEDFARIVAAMNEAGMKTFGAEANAYAALKLDYIYNAPTKSSATFALDADIPFYQMVFKGSVAMSGGAINLAQDPRAEFLKTIATGCSLGYSLCYEGERQLLLGDHSAIGSSVYDGLAEQLETYTKEAQPLLSLVRSANIVYYAMDGEVSTTIFDNGVTLCVNHGNTSADSMLGTIDALSFRFQ